MRINLPLTSLWSALSNHNYNAALQIYGRPAMFSNALQLPALPTYAVRETNRETLERLGHDLTLIGDSQLSAADSYRLYGHDELDRPFWGYGVEAARVDDSRGILVLIWSDDFKLFSDRNCCFLRITSNHDNVDSGISALFDCFVDLWPHWVFDAYVTNK